MEVVAHQHQNTSPRHIPTEDQFPSIVTPQQSSWSLPSPQMMTGTDDFPEVVVAENLPHHSPSSFHHDDEEKNNNHNNATTEEGSRCTEISERKGRLGQPFSIPSKKRKLVAFLAILLGVVVAGAIVGGLFGSGLVHIGNHSANTSISYDAEHSQGGNGLEMHASSQIAAAAINTPISTDTIVLFQTADDQLAAIEWKGSMGNVYLLQDRAKGDTKIPKPIVKASFNTVTFGPDSDLHVFYFDETLRITHIVHRSKNKPQEAWEQGSLSLFGLNEHAGPEYMPSITLRMASTVLLSDWTSFEEDYLVLTYATAVNTTSVALLYCTDPNKPIAWKSSAVSLEVKGLDLEPYPESPGFLTLPIKQTPFSEGDDPPGVRIIWDLQNDMYKTTFGILDCPLNEDGHFGDCATLNNPWRDTAAEEVILNLPKPLRLSSVSIDSDSPSPLSNRHIMRVLDHDGQMTELLWDTKGCTGHLGFTNQTATSSANNFTSATSVDNGLLYAITDGKLAEFSRETAWWEDAAAEGTNSTDDAGLAWKYIDEVNLAVPQD